jgi:hypothetical protein
MLQRIKKFGELSWNEQLLFSEAYFLQLTIGLLLKIIPFRWILKLFSNKAQDTRFKVQGTRNPEPGTRNPEPGIRNPEPGIRNPEHGTWNQEPGTLALIKTATQRVSRISPWKNKCLVSSLAARRMLNRRKIQSQLSLGVAKGEKGEMIAHAWLKVGDFEIVEKGREFSELYLF